MELGLLPGTAVEVVRVAPLGDPIELSVRGCLLSIRREEAARIEIVSLADDTRALAEARPGDQSSSPPLKRVPDGPSVPAAS